MVPHGAWFLTEHGSSLDMVPHGAWFLPAEPLYVWRNFLPAESGSSCRSDSQLQEEVMKILVVGDPTVGKTSFVQRYVNGTFSRTYKATVGVDFSVKVLQWSDQDRIRLQIWDIAGQERFTSMTRIYYRGALGCVLMFDVTNQSSFLRCQQWKQDLDNKAMLPGGAALPCMLLANKCDLPDRAVSAENIAKFAKSSGFVAWMETSAKDNKNVGEAMRRLVQEILSTQARLDPEPPGPEDSVRLQPHAAAAARTCC